MTIRWTVLLGGTLAAALFTAAILSAAALADAAADEVSAAEVQGADLDYNQCDEAGGFHAGDICRNYDEQQAATVLSEDRHEERERNESIASGEANLSPDELSYEECIDAGGFYSADRCNNYDERDAREQVAERNQPASEEDEDGTNPIASTFAALWEGVKSLLATATVVPGAVTDTGKGNM